MKRVLLLVAALFMVAGVASAQVCFNIEPTTAGEGDDVNLTITVDGEDSYVHHINWWNAAGSDTWDYENGDTVTINLTADMLASDGSHLEYGDSWTAFDIVGGEGLPETWADLVAAGGVQEEGCEAAPPPGDLCDCDWEAVLEEFLDTGYDWLWDEEELFPNINWELMDTLTITGTVAVGETVVVSHEGFWDLMHLATADCEPVVGWDNGMWGTWDIEDPGDISIPNELYAGSPAFGETLREDHFGLWITAFWGDGDNIPFLLCPAGAAPPEPASPVQIAGPYKAEEGDDVTLVMELDGVEAVSQQWKKNGEDLEGETGTELALVGVSEDDEGDYTVVIDDGEEALVEIESDPHVLLIFPVGAVPLAGGLGLGLLAGAFALAGAVTIRRKK